MQRGDNAGGTAVMAPGSTMVLMTVPENMRDNLRVRFGSNG